MVAGVGTSAIAVKGIVMVKINKITMLFNTLRFIVIPSKSYLYLHFSRLLFGIVYLANTSPLNFSIPG
jgi:hypothetical protein